MDMPRLLIADSCDEFRQILFSTLSGEYIIQTCSSGAKALSLLRSFRPQLMILDLALPELDGLSLLQRASQENIRPAVLVTGTYTSPYIQSALQRLDVGYFMPKPCDLTAIADRLKDFTAELYPAPVPVADLEASATELLLALSVPPHLDGFLFLQRGIPLLLRDPCQSMTKELYVEIGAPFHKNFQQVERSIRSAVEAAWRNGDRRIWADYFSAPNGQILRPSNSQFLSRIVAVLIQQGFRFQSA